jgi:pimeloyl-ACP methyl ester carboxylesterase
LVHGAWHGAWCWRKIVLELQANKCNVIALDLPGHGDDPINPKNVTLDDYVKKVISVVNEQTDPVILVGHYMAGVVISQAAEDLGRGKIAALVYLDAFMPQNGESVFSLAGMAQQQSPPLRSGTPTIMDCLIPSEDKLSSVFKPEMAFDFFYHDCSEEDVAFAKANLSVQAFAPLTTPVTLTDTVYGRIPKYYILCTKSRDMDKKPLSIHVNCERVYELGSSHSPFFSMPEELARLLQEIYSLS